MLEASGFLVRANDEDDGRVTTVKLTPRGGPSIGAIRTTQMKEVLSAWPVAERVPLACIVNRLVNDLKGSSVPSCQHQQGRHHADA